MTRADRITASLHARRPRMQHLAEEAQRIVGAWLDCCKKPYVAFSGGKDSAVLLHLVRSMAPGVPALFGDDEYLLPGTEDFVLRTPNVVRICGPVDHCAWFRSWSERPEVLPRRAVWVDSGGDSAVRTYARMHGFDGAAVGITMHESGVRKTHILTQRKRHGDVFFNRSRGVWQCYPLMRWKPLDVWAYIVSQDLAYNPAYDAMAVAGIPLERRRVGPFAPRGAVVPALTNIRRTWPGAFNHFATRYPMAQTCT